MSPRPGLSAKNAGDILGSIRDDFGPAVEKLGGLSETFHDQSDKCPDGSEESLDRCRAIFGGIAGEAVIPPGYSGEIRMRIDGEIRSAVESSRDS